MSRERRNHAQRLKLVTWLTSMAIVTVGALAFAIRHATH